MDVKDVFITEAPLDDVFENDVTEQSSVTTQSGYIL
jgi:hypothetical protein